MKLDRRDILKGTGALIATSALAGRAAAEGAQPATTFAPAPRAWRTFEVKTVVELPTSPGAAQAWIPIPGFSGEGWVKPGETTWSNVSGTAEIARDAKSGASMVHLTWPEAAGTRTAEIASRVTTRDRAVDVGAAGSAALSADERARYTAASKLIVTDGIVKETADKIVAGKNGELDKARAIYQWVVDNTYRNAATKGCGTGDIASLLKSGNLGGKCADINALYVGLARAAGLAARDIYGIRVAPSAFGYKSLGANSATITKAQHCRAEVFLSGVGWVPADPADVRKVILEEPPGNLALTDAKVEAARAALFGAWETNWLAYNDAHDVALPGSAGGTLPFLMYPQAETSAGRLDCLDADGFRYVISVKEVAA